MALRLGDGVLRILGDTSDVNSKVGGLKNRLNGLFGTAGRLALGGLAASVLATGGAAVRGTLQFASFEDAMLNTRTMAAWTDEEMGKVSDEIMTLSKNFPNAYGGAQSLATAFYDIVSAGVPAEDAMSVLEAAAIAATGGATDTAIAVDGLTTVLNAFKMDAKDSKKVTDVMFAAVAAGKMTFEELASTMYDVAPIAAANGVKFEQVAAGLATMTKMGTPARVATTQLRGAIQAIINPSDKMKKMLKEAGYESGKAALKAEGLHGVLNMVAESADGSGEKMMDLIPSIEGAQAVMALTGKNAKGAAADLDLMGEATDGVGMAQKAMDTKMTGLSSQWGRLMSVVGVATTKFGASLAPTLKTVVGWLEQLVNGTGPVGKGFQQVSSIAGGIFSAAFKAIPVIFGAIGKAIGWFTKNILPTLLVVMGGIADFMRAVWPGIRDIIVSVFEAASVAIGWFTTNVLPTLMRWVQTIVGFFVENWPLIDNTLRVAMAVAKFVIDSMVQSFMFLLSIISDVWPAIQVVIETVMGIIGGILKTIMALIAGDWGKAWEGIKDIFESLWNGIVKFIGTIPGLILGILKGLLFAVMGWAGGLAKGLLAKVIGMIGKLVGNFATLPSRVMGAVSGLVGRFFGWLGSLAGRAIRAVGELIGSFVGWFRKLPAKAVNAVKSLPGKMVDFLKSIPGKILNSVLSIGKSIMDGIVRGVTNAIGGAIDAVTGAVGSVVDGVMGFLGIASPSKVFEQIGRYTMDGLAVGLGDASKAQAALDRAMGALTGRGLNLSGETVGALSGAMGRGTAPIHIENLHLPNVSNADEFVDALRHMSDSR